MAWQQLQEGWGTAVECFHRRLRLCQSWKVCLILCVSVGLIACTDPGMHGCCMHAFPSLAYDGLWLALFSNYNGNLQVLLK